MDHTNFQMPGAVPPHPMNHPPQIFGAYGPDGLPQMPQLAPDVTAQMFPDAQLFYDDPQDPKRRRIARVCLRPLHQKKKRVKALSRGEKLTELLGL